MKARERIELTAGWAEWDHGSYVQVGDRAVPQRIDVTFPNTPDGWPSLHLTIEVRGGAPHCTELTMKAHPEGREIRGVDSRAVHLEEWVDLITAEASLWVDTAADGSISLRRATGLLNGDDAEYQHARRTIRKARSGARRKVTDDLLRKVAKVYRENVTDRPVEHVQGSFGTTYRTAARYVQRARAAGFLPATSQGKVSG